MPVPISSSSSDSIGEEDVMTFSHESLHRPFRLLSPGLPPRRCYTYIKTLHPNVLLSWWLTDICTSPTEVPTVWSLVTQTYPFLAQLPPPEQEPFAWFLDRPASNLIMANLQQPDYAPFSISGPQGESQSVSQLLLRYRKPQHMQLADTHLADTQYSRRKPPRSVCPDLRDRAIWR